MWTLFVSVRVNYFYLASSKELRIRNRYQVIYNFVWGKNVIRVKSILTLVYNTTENWISTCAWQWKYFFYILELFLSCSIKINLLLVDL